MNVFKKTEIIILSILWAMSLTTYSIALLNNYVLYTSDYLGLFGLALATAVCYFKPEKSFQSLLVLLILGTFNLVSFVYFFNIVLTFGISVLATPGIQLISLVFLIILVIKSPKQVGTLYQLTFGQTDEEREYSKESIQNGFKRKFEKLTDREIDIKLQQNLVPEAMAVLNSIKEDRKNALLKEKNN